MRAKASCGRVPQGQISVAQNHVLSEHPAKFASTSFRPLLLASGAPPFRSAHIAGLLSRGKPRPCRRPYLLASLTSHRLHPSAPCRLLHRLLVAVVLDIYFIEFLSLYLISVFLKRYLMYNLDAEF